MTDTPPDYPAELVERALEAWFAFDHITAPEATVHGIWLKRMSAALDASGLREAQQELARLRIDRSKCPFCGNPVGYVEREDGTKCYDQWCHNCDDEASEREQRLVETMAERDALEQQRDELVEALGGLLSIAEANTAKEDRLVMQARAALARARKETP